MKYFSLAVSLLACGCAAQVASRSQQAINATLNTADAVVATCPAGNASAQAAASACRSAANAVQSASSAYQNASEAATYATKARVSAEQRVTDTRNEITNLDQNPNELQLRDSDPALKGWRTYVSEDDKVAEGLLHTIEARVKSHVASSEKTFDTIWTDVLNSPAASKATLSAARARYNAALAVAKAAATAIDSASDYPAAVLAGLKAEWALDKAEHELRSAYDQLVLLPQLSAAAAQAAQQESSAIASREKAKADLQAALDNAKAATLTADAQAQSCGGQPINVRIPGYAETFWDISS